MNLAQIFRILVARKRVLLAATLACLIAAVLAGVLIPARYKASSRVMLNVVKPDPVTGEVIASQFARAYVQTQTELIRDYRIAGKVVDELGWLNSPTMAESYENRASDDVRDFRRWAAQQIIDNTKAELLEGSNILEISYTAPDPQAAAQVADAIRQAYIDQAIAFKRDDAGKNSDWFRKQADEVREQLAAAEKRKSDFERANGIVLGDDNVDEESRKLSALAASSPPISAGPTVSMSAGNPMAGQIAQANAAIAAAERTLGPNNPDLINMKRQRDALVASSAAVAPRPVVQGQAGPSLGAMFGSQTAKVLAQRGKVDEARKLAVDVTVLRDLYAKTKARAADFDQQMQSTDSGLTLLGAATAPEKPSWPRWPLIIPGALVLGLGIGVLAALFTELLRRRVRGTEDLRFGDVPVLGTMTPPIVEKRSWPFIGRSNAAGAA